LWIDAKSFLEAERSTASRAAWTGGMRKVAVFYRDFQGGGRACSSPQTMEDPWFESVKSSATR